MASGQYYGDNTLTPYVVPVTRRLSTVCFLGRQGPSSPCTNLQNSPPEAKPPWNVMTSNEPRPFLHWTRLGHVSVNVKDRRPRQLNLVRRCKRSGTNSQKMAIGRIIRSLPRQPIECLTHRGSITHNIKTTLHTMNAVIRI